MQDFLFLATTLVFFVIAIGYTYGCSRCKETLMELWLAGISTIGLTVYLLYALIRPERF